MISPEDVRQLLNSDEPDPSLVLLQGKVEVVSAQQLRDGKYAGALHITSREELLDRVSRGEFSDRDLAEVASSLDTVVSHLGG